MLQYRTKKWITYSFLLSFFFSGIGVFSGLPIFITALANAHPVFFSQNNQKIRIILHHPGNKDVHEANLQKPHEHGLLEQVIGVSQKKGRSQGDHEVEISALEDRFAHSAQQELKPKIETYSALTSFFPALSREHQFHVSGLSPPLKQSRLDSLRTTILII